MALKTAHNKKALIKALEDNLGVVTAACKVVGCARHTYYDYYNSDSDFKKAADDTANIALDFAESQLYKQIKAGTPSSTIFYLKTKGKKRGYDETITFEMPAPILIKAEDGANIALLSHDKDA